MDSRFIEELRKLMKSVKIEVSYFAAGIVAHFASGDFKSWTVTSVSKEEITNELVNIVSNWETPESEMVAYRSFTPFFPLMAENQEYSVQLWAIWAIHHVCSKNPKRYLPMLVYQEGIKVLLTLVDAKVQGLVFQLSQEILLALLKEVQLKRNSKLYQTENEISEISKSNIHTDETLHISTPSDTFSSDECQKSSDFKSKNVENEDSCDQNSDSENEDDCDEDLASSDADEPMQEVNYINVFE